MQRNHDAAMHLAAASQLCYTMRLHQESSNAAVADVIEATLRRRIFWHVYAVDM